ncbi:uncharacterized protein LOC143076030 [Mytilus galloprovincialis]|uniref:uncharacterized protein LOC143076030 n=1 Tax=Mytilus galloprovincialis TaxID=29158 RepID=UPI003F7C03BC
MEFFTNLVSKDPAIYWPLSKTLFKILKGDDPKGFFKIQACSLLAVIINTNVQDSLEEPEWDSLTTESLEAIEYAVRNMDRFQKSKLLEEVVIVLSRLFQMSEKAVLSRDIVKILLSHKQKFSPNVRRRCNIVMNKQQAHIYSAQSQQKKRKSDTDIKTEQISPDKKTKIEEQ